MRPILVDRARARATNTRGGGGPHGTLKEDAIAADDQPAALPEIDEALNRLSAFAPRLGQLVVLRFFGGLTDAEIGDALDVTPRTGQRNWIKPHMLLQRELAL